MAEFILFMHAASESYYESWAQYIQQLMASGCFQGGSAIGDGLCFRKDGETVPVTQHIVGYLRIEATDIDEAKLRLTRNPHYEAGGTVEIRELPRTD